MRSQCRTFAVSRWGGVLLALACASVYWAPAFARPESLGPDDWAYFQHMWDVGWVALKRYGEVALWDPFQCGGVPMLGDPQAQIYGPWFLLSFLVGTTLALKLGIVIHALISLLSMYRYASAIHHLSPVASALAAATFTGSGFFAWHISAGHAPFVPFFLLPLVLVAYHRACVDRRMVAGLALLLALLLFEGGVYPLPFSLVLLAFEACARALRTRRFVESLWPLAAACLGFALLAGLRWIPALVELDRHPRPIADLDYLGIDDLVSMLTLREHPSRVAGHIWPWHEYSSFVGIGVSVLALVGYHLALVRRRPHAALGALLFVLLACGQLGYASPWALLQRLPVFDSLRVPSRFIVVGTLFLALLAGLALDEVRGALERLLPVRSAAHWASLALAVACIADILIVTRPIVDRWQGEALPPMARSTSSAFQHGAASDFKAEFAALPRLGRGSAGCYTVLDYAPAPSLRVGPVPQAEVVRGDASIDAVRTSVNSVKVEVSAATPATLLINQNFSPDFVSNLGPVYEEFGLLAVDVPAGNHRLRVTHRPSALRLGLASTIAGLLLTLGYLLFFWRRATRVEAG